ncbi:hypothetical protein [Microbacterium sp.]|uniref:CdiA C-terminal domain-containing protein n=1 Tax=Microbacterium sp. TaxID=51671 RepID=UPI0039E3EA52
MTIPDGMPQPPSAHEVATAIRLARHGHSVIFRRVDNTPGAVNPDAIVDGEVWEFKSPRGASERSTIAEQFKQARRQSHRMVLDLARCGLPDEVSLNQALRRFHGQRAITELIVIDHRGRLLKASLG